MCKRVIKLANNLHRSTDGH